MVESTAGGVAVRKDSAGVWRDASEVAATDSSAMLPTSDFTEEQKAMAKLPLPFRNLIRDPFVAAVGVVTAYGAYADQIAAKGCSSFRIINPNQCYIRFRGATGTNDTMSDNQGRLMAPGAVETFSTQNPTHLAVMAVPRPGFPVPAELAPVELNYGIGG